MTIGTLDDLAALPGMPKRTTLRHLIIRHPDFPFEERGGPGRAHKIDLERAASFVRAVRNPPAPPIDADAAREAIEAMGLMYVDADKLDG